MVGDEVREAAERPLVSSADYGQDFDKMMKLKTQREEDRSETEFSKPDIIPHQHTVILSVNLFR